MNRVMLLLSLLVIPQYLLAEPVAEEKSAEHKFSGNFEIGGFQTTGNTVSESIDGLLELGYGYDIWSADFMFKGSQTSESKVLTSDYYESSLKGKVELPMHTYYFLFFGYRQDEFSGFTSEITKLTGFGYHMYEDEPKYGADIEIGYGLRDTKKLIKTTIDHDPGVHGALFAYYNFSEKDVLKANFTIESGNDDDFIKKEYIWEHTLYEHLTMDFSYEERTLTKPEIGKEATDTNLSMKLGYNF